MQWYYHLIAFEIVASQLYAFCYVFDKSAEISDAQNHIYCLHLEFIQNLVDLKHKLRHSSMNNVVVAVSVLFNCKMLYIQQACFYFEK